MCYSDPLRDYSASSWSYNYETEISRLKAAYKPDFEEIEKANENLKTKVIAAVCIVGILALASAGIVLTITTFPIALCVFGLALCVGILAAQGIIACSSDSDLENRKENLIDEINEKARQHADSYDYPQHSGGGVTINWAYRR